MRTTKTLLTITCAAALTLAGCSADTTGAAEGKETAQETSSSTEAQWPRTVTVGGAEVTVKEQPKRIAVLSPGAASLAAELVPADRLAALAGFGGEMPAGVEEIRANTQIDPEQVLGLNPDLIILTSRHGQEQDAGKLLGDAGVPVAVFGGGDWATSDAVLANLRTLGELTGLEAKADEMAGRIEDQRKAVLDAVAAHKGEAPRVLTLMARGDKKMVTPASALINGLVEEAGGVAANDELGGHGPAAADPETIAKARPDVILVEDFRGQGKADFADLLANPALASVPAVADGRVAYLPTNLVTVEVGPHVAEGLDAVAKAIGTKE